MNAVAESDPLAAAQARIKELELLVGIRQDDAMNVFRLAPSMRKLLALLMANEYVTADLIGTDIQSDAKVAIHRLRALLEPWGIEIKSRRFVGYWLTAETKIHIKNLITPTVTAEAVEPPHGPDTGEQQAAAA